MLCQSPLIAYEEWRSAVDCFARLYRSTLHCCERTELFILFLLLFPFSNVTFLFRVLAMNSEKGSHCQLSVQINRFVLIHWVIGNISSNKAFCLAHAKWPGWIKDVLHHLLRRVNLIVNIRPWCRTILLKKNGEVRNWPEWETQFQLN